MSAVTVTGGADGITARMADLVTMAGLLRAGSTALHDALDVLNAPMLRWQLADVVPNDLCAAFTAHDELVDLAGPFGPLALTAEHLEVMARGLHFAVGMYEHADQTVLDSIVGGLGHLLAAGMLAGIGDLGGARDELYDGLPGLTDLSMSIAGPFEAPFAAAVPDGHAVLHDLGPDTRPESMVAPNTLAALIGGLALRNGGHHGEISVSFVVGADGVRRAIVDIPGTKSWNPAPTGDITGVGTDIRALTGQRTAYEDGVFAALTAAGVGPDEDVLLVGHSEGGIVAINAARRAAASGRFRVTHVVTAGSPIGRVARTLPASVQVLALENAADVVPHCDAADNPDRPNLTTVTVDEQHHDIVANHDLVESYEPAAADADASGNASIRAFTKSAHGFLTGSAMHTHAYWLTRAR
jgi:hypothetical protein